MPQFPVEQVMISGHFDPFHDGHLDYLRQAIAELELWQTLICVVSSDIQLMLKKGRVNIQETGRREIVDLILKGLNVPHITFLNEWDTETTLVAKALTIISPRVFFRGGDKTLEDMPSAEYQACINFNIQIKHAELRVDRHGAGMKI